MEANQPWQTVNWRQSELLPENIYNTNTHPHSQKNKQKKKCNLCLLASRILQRHLNIVWNKLAKASQGKYNSNTSHCKLTNQYSTLKYPGLKLTQCQVSIAPPQYWVKFTQNQWVGLFIHHHLVIGSKEPYFLDNFLPIVLCQHIIPICQLCSLFLHLCIGFFQLIILTVCTCMDGYLTSLSARAHCQIVWGRQQRLSSIIPVMMSC